MGGVAGVTLTADVATEDLPAERAAQVQNALTNLPWGTRAEPPYPDALRYEITRLDVPSGKSVLLGERDVPPDLDYLIQIVTEKGTFEPRSDAG